ncbi:MAG: ExbD/TolR family protein [Arenimonas sp.]
MSLIAARETPMAEMNITPLVDVMLVLLVIFMIAAPAMTQSLSLTLPYPGDPPKVPPTEMTLQVQAGDLFALDGQVMSRKQITATLATEVARNPDIKVNFDVDPNAEYESAMLAMAAVRNAGIEAIALPSQD